MKNNILFSLSVVVILIMTLSACNFARKDYMNKSEYDTIINLNPKNKNADLVIYYFDGDCSLCIAKVRYIEKVLKNNRYVKLLFIAKTLNPDILKFNLNNIKLKSYVFIDKNDFFNNKLNMNEVIRLNMDRSQSVYEIK